MSGFLYVGSSLVWVKVKSRVILALNAFIVRGGCFGVSSHKFFNFILLFLFIFLSL